MSDVRCDEMEVVDDRIDEVISTKTELEAPSSNIDVMYSTKIAEDMFEVNMDFVFQIKNDDVSVMKFHAPYVLKYSLEKYERYGEQCIINSALNETQSDAFQRLYFPTVAYFMYKLKYLTRKVH